jgi:hypothetical protein
MAIPEAFDRYKASAQQQDSSRFAEHRIITEQYASLQLKKGISILRRNKVPQLLGELREHVAGVHPDATLVPSIIAPQYEDVVTDGDIKYWLDANGTVAMGMEWDYEEVDTDTPWTDKYCNALIVAAQPLTGAIVVKSNGADFIPAETLESPKGREVLEDAVVSAFKTSPRWSPPTQIG